MVQDVHHSRYCRCGNPVTEGPEGGFVCPLCYHVEESPGEEMRRRATRRARQVSVAAAQARRRAQQLKQ